MTLVAIPLFLFIAGMTGYRLVKLELGRERHPSGLPKWGFRAAYAGAFVVSLAAAMLFILERLGVAI